MEFYIYHVIQVTVFANESIVMICWKMNEIDIVILEYCNFFP